GAAVLTDKNNVYSGGNIENSSYSLTCCAERVAIFSAVNEKDQNIIQIVVIANSDEPISPCGACRQVMSEFCHEDTEVILLNNHKDEKRTTMGELLPYSFKLKKS